MAMSPVVFQKSLKRHVEFCRLQTELTCFRKLKLLPADCSFEILKPGSSLEAQFFNVQDMTQIFVTNKRLQFHPVSLFRSMVDTLTA